MDWRPVDPVRPAAGYIGGKRNLARRLVDRIEAIPHDGYAEAFVGMGGVFLRRRQAPPVEAINDVSGDVATFFRILQRHYTHFLEMLRFQVAKGRFILSISDRTEVRSIFHGFETESVDATYTISAGAPGRSRELIITGGSKGL